MKTINLFNNPDNCCITGVRHGEDTNNFIYHRKNTIAQYIDDIKYNYPNNKINIQGVTESEYTLICFGGNGELGDMRLGMKCGSTYTVSLYVHLETELRGKLHPHALTLHFDYLDSSGKINWFYNISKAAPNTPGIWELSLTFSIPDDAKGAWISFTPGASNNNGEVAISHIRVTETDLPVAPFCNNEIVTPYIDSVSSGPEKICSRSYSNPIDLGYEKFITYLKYAKEGGYLHDLIETKKTINNIVYLFLFELFIDSTISNSHKKSIIKELKRISDSTLDLIIEETYLIGEVDFVKELLFNCHNNSLQKVIIDCQFLCNNKKMDDAKQVFNNSKEVKSPSNLLNLSNIFHICAINDGAPIVQRYWNMKFLLFNYSEIKRRAKLLVVNNSHRIKKVEKDKLPIFLFWDKGLENAPVIVKKNIDCLNKLFPGRVHFLDSTNLKYYVSNNLRENISRMSHFSDVLRCELLMRYGGMWCDATVLVRPELKHLLENSSLLPVYFPTQKQIGSWLLYVDEAYSYTYCLMYSALMMYLDKYGDFNEYFMFHTFWKTLSAIDSKMNNFVKKSYKLNAGKAIAFGKYKMTSVLYNDDFLNIFNNSPVHKLTYKYDDNNLSLDSIISKLIRSDANT